ncbi:hypothetical protein ACVWXL_005116 [Bradyrhizobium sp. GM22.5]
MRLRNSYPGIALGFLVGLATTAAAASDRELRVCADPNNLPFSNSAEAGFENRLAAMVAEHFGLQVSYTWWAQRRGFIRNTLKAGKCDVVMGVPSGYDLVETTKPYYRSSYVFVTRQDQHLELSSLLDPRLHHLAIGVHLIGDDGNNPPPAQALGEQGIVDNVRGYSIYGDYREANPPARLIESRRKRQPRCRRSLGSARRIFRPALSRPPDGHADPGLRALCTSAVPVRHRDGRAQRRRRLARPTECIHRRAPVRDHFAAAQLRRSAGGPTGYGIGRT